MAIPILIPATPKKRRLTRWVVGLLLAYAVLGFLILPPIIRAVAVKNISKQLDREVSIEKVRLNPFTLSATIRGLLIKDQDGQPFVSWDEVYVNFQLSSFLGRAWVFKEVSTTKPFVRVRMNRDRSLNFSDLLAKFATNAPPQPAAPARPRALRIYRLRIAGAAASLTDLTPSTPFTRMVGPLDITLENFHTDPASKNPYSFSGTTDAGEKLAWSGHFYLDPLRSEGDLSLENLALNKYAPLYQDLVRFEIRDGVVDVHSTYRIELTATNRIVSVTNTSFALHSFQLAEPGSAANIVELPEFSVRGVSADLTTRQAAVNSMSATGAKLALRRDTNNAINVVEFAKPAETATNAPGGIMLLLQSVTNAVTMLLQSTNAWTGAIREVSFQDCALSLEDLANARPVSLSLDQITFAARDISNLPGTNLTASLALRWNTNGSIQTDVSASLQPPTVDIQLAFTNLELRALDPYLEPRLNVFIIDSQLSLNGRIHLRTTNDALPEVTFRGDVWLNNFSTVDGALGEDLLKWASLRFAGIDANLNPPTVAIEQVALDDAYARVVIETNRTINLLAALRAAEPAGSNAPPAEVRSSGLSRSGPPEGGTPNLQPASIESPSPRDEGAGRGPGRGATDQNIAGTSSPQPSPPLRGREGAMPAALPKISIASVIISNAQARFTDRSMTPNVNLSIQQAGGTISGLSSEELQHADVNLHAKVDGVGPAAITGTINPFSQTSTNELKIVVSDVDLTPTSPYAGKFAGYRIAKGKLGLSLAYHLQGRNLKSENLVTLDQFTFGEKVESPDATKLPVRLAIAILKDRNGKIELDVPIEGNLDSPEFRLRKVIVGAVVNLLTKVATSPFSLLGAVFGGQGEEIRFQDFAPGEFTLRPAGRDKLDALVKGLYERPALQLEIEGSIDPQTDRDGLRRVMLEKRMRAEKWQSLRKSSREAITPEQITLTPEERGNWVGKFYAEALAAGRIVAATNQPGESVSSGTSSTPALITPPAKAARTDEKGATALMKTPEQPIVVAASAGGGLAQKPLTRAEQMEQALLGTVSVGDSDFAALAADRAKAVRAYLLQTGKVEPERLFLTEKESGGVKTDGSRAYLQLR